MVDDDSSQEMPYLDIYGLHRAHALNEELTDVFAAAATVALDQHHTSPQAWSVQLDEQDARLYAVAWRAPTDGDRRTYGNDDETTELGACAIALAAAEAHLGLVAYARARPRTGIDFYLLATRADLLDIVSYDFDHRAAVGLEVSGINRDDSATMNNRLRAKVEQVRKGDSPDRAIAGVVGFQTARVVFRTAKP